MYFKQSKANSFFLSVTAVIFLLTPSISHANLRNGLVGWWKFDESSGNAVDSSGNGNTGTPTGTTIVANCKRGGCRSFNGSSDYVNPSAITTLGTTYTISAWVNLDKVTGNQEAVAQRRATAGNGLTFQLDSNGDDARFIVRDDANNIETASYADILTVGKWYHLVGVRNGDTVSVYVNTVKGTDDSSQLFGTITDDSLNIGALVVNSSTRSAFLDGFIDDVRIYNRVLSTQEIADLYRSGIVIRNAVIRNAVINKK